MFPFFEELAQLLFCLDRLKSFGSEALNGCSLARGDEGFLRVVKFVLVKAAEK